VWVNPALDSIRHPLQLAQKRFYRNASCVSDQPNPDAAYVRRLKALMDPETAMRLLLMAFDYNYDEVGRRGPDHGVRVIVAHCASLGTRIDSRRSGEPKTATRNWEERVACNVLVMYRRTCLLCMNQR
jgi:hypothetical protein